MFLSCIDFIIAFFIKNPLGGGGNLFGFSFIFSLSISALSALYLRIRDRQSPETRPNQVMSHKLLFLQIDSKIEDLMNMLECPVCLDTADRPPIYQCTEGHLLCESCNHRLSACPQCGHSLLNSRNRTAEGLAVKLQVSPF